MTRRPGFSVKDSFVTLDLSGLGFDVLFEATWLWHDPVGRSFLEPVMNFGKAGICWADDTEGISQ
jgi:hypothetical protein